MAQKKGTACSFRCYCEIGFAINAPLAAHGGLRPRELKPLGHVVRKALYMAAPLDLNKLRAEFLASSTLSMPIAGILFWLAALVASRFLPAQPLAFFVGFGSGAVFPLGMIIDRMRGHKPVAASDNPVTHMFLQCLAAVAMLWPLVILAGIVAPGLVVLGGAILMGIVWIPYGWAAADPAGLRHAIARTILCYGAYLFVPIEWKLSAVCMVPLLCYGYSLVAMKKPQ